MSGWPWRPRVAWLPGRGRLPGPATPFDIPLQWFAAEDEGRTEEPTEHKLRKAREEGKVAHSAELTSSVVLLFAAAAVGFLATSMLRTIMPAVEEGAGRDWRDRHRSRAYFG